MKVWEKIKAFAKKEFDIDFTSSNEIKEWLKKREITPSGLQATFNFVSESQLGALCDNYVGNCEKCLDAYLDIEIEESEVEV